MRIKFIRKIKQRINDIKNVCSVAGLPYVYEMVIIPHWGKKKDKLARCWRKHEAIINFLEKEYATLIKKYSLSVQSVSHPIIAKKEAPIWVCWWQGESQMPPIVRSCYQSLLENAGEHPVRLITEESIDQYIQIPTYILQKVKKGNISFTHFSDIIRMALLYEHGGLWLDATIYVSRPLKDKIFDSPLFSVAPNIDTELVSQAKWSGFLLGGYPQEPLFGFVRDFFFEYWKKENRLIDYFLIDYAIYIIRQNSPYINVLLESIPKHYKIFDMEQNLDKPYDKEYFTQLCHQQTFHKLNYKIKYTTYTADHKQTIYGYLIKGIKQYIK